MVLCFFMYLRSFCFCRRGRQPQNFHRCRELESKVYFRVAYPDADGADGEAAEPAGSRVVSATLRAQVRRVHPLPAGARPCAAGDACDRRVLPRGLALQVRQPPVHAMTSSNSQLPRRAQARTLLRGVLYSDVGQSKLYSILWHVIIFYCGGALWRIYELSCSACDLTYHWC